MTRTEKEHLDELLGALREERLGAAEFVQLQNIIANDDAARRHYIEYMMLIVSLRGPQGGMSVQLEDESELAQTASAIPLFSDRQESAKTQTPLASTDPQLPIPRAAVLRRRDRLLGHRDWKIRGMAAALAVLAASLAWVIFGPKASQPQAVSNTGPTTTPTMLVTIPPVQLETGFTRLTLDGNVQVLIQGPAEYAIDSSSRIRLNVGRLTAVVPHSVTGFTVITKDASITDLGTEFAVEAGEQFTKTQVFDGRVMVEPRNNANPVQQILSVGQANRVYDGQMVPEEPYAPSFVRVGDYDTRQAAEIRNAAVLARWTAFSHKLRRDPSLLAYYTFDNEAESRWKLLNRAASTAGKYDGEIFNASWEQGHLPGRGALAFNGKSSGVKIDIPDQLRELTVAMWVCIDSFDHDHTALFESDDWNRPGEFHWEFLPNHHHTFGSFQTWNHDFTLISAFPVKPNARWIHLAGTFDVRGEKIILYRDGLAEVSGNVPGAVVMSIGSARIGSWEHGTAKQPERLASRTLDGRIDELAVFSRVLSGTEIHEMYEAEREGQ